VKKILLGGTLILVAGIGGTSLSCRTPEREVAATRPARPATLRLVTGERGKPLGRAEVRILVPGSGAEAQVTESDDDGRIHFAVPSREDRYEVLVFAPDAGFARVVCHLAERAVLDLGEVALDPGHVLEMFVTDGSGEPAAGIAIDLELLEPCDLDLVSLASFVRIEETTGAAGWILIKHLPAGTYSLRLPALPYTVTDPEAWILLRVPEGSPFPLRLSPQGRIRGRVTDARGNPIPGARATVWYSEYEMRDVLVDESHLRTDSRGVFIVKLPPGLEEERRSVGAPPDAVRLRIEHPLFVEKEIPIPRLPEVGETIDLGTIILVAGSHLIVRIPGIEPDELGDWSLIGADGEDMANWAGLGHSQDSVEVGGDSITIEGIPAGTYWLRIDAAGYRPWASDAIALAAGETRTIVANLERGVTLEGTVIDAETSARIPGANVSVRTLTRDHHSTTDERGRFALTGLVPGPAILSVGCGSFTASVDIGGEKVDPIRLPAPEPRPPSPAEVALRMIVEPPDGRQIAKDAPCFIDFDDGLYRFPLKLDTENGWYHHSFQWRGPFRFRVWAGDFLPSEWIEVKEFQGAGLGPLRIRMREGPRMRVIASFGDGTPAAGVRVRVRDRYADLFDRWSGTTDARGELDLRPVPPGLVELEIGGDGVAHEERRFTYDGGVLRIPVVREAILDLTIRYPGEPFCINVYAAGMRRAEYVLLSSICNLEVGGIPPGSHKIWVTGWEDQLDYACREFEITEGARKSIEIDIPIGSIEGRLIDAPSDAVASPPGLELWPSGPYPPPNMIPSYQIAGLRPTGLFSFPSVPPGRYRIECATGPGAPLRREVEVKASETTRADLEYRFFTLRGRISTPDGKAVPRARITIEQGRPGRSDSFDLEPGGRFSIFGVAQGRQSVIAEAPGYIPERRSIDMDRDRTIDFVLRRGAPVAVTIPLGRGWTSASVFWRDADGSLGYAGWVNEGGELAIPPSAISLRFECDEGPVLEEPLIKEESGGFAPVRAEVPPSGVRFPLPMYQL